MPLYQLLLRDEKPIDLDKYLLEDQHEESLDTSPIASDPNSPFNNIDFETASPGKRVEPESPNFNLKSDPDEEAQEDDLNLSNSPKNIDGVQIVKKIDILDQPDDEVYDL